MNPSSLQHRFWHRLGFWAFGLLFTFGNSFRVFGRCRVPKTGPFLIIANHESFWDPPIVGITLGRRVTYMARKTLFINKIGSYLIRMQGAFPVDQDGTGMDGIRTALQMFEKGEGVIVFPEGTRTPDGTMKEFMAGIVLLIRRAKVPVLPVGVAGAYDAWPIHAGRPKWSPLLLPANKATICCCIGEMIPTEKLLAMKPADMLAFLTDEVAKVRAEAYARKRK
jgi:1-acyl-sn-glycerol-3-phosphate acyltransferase